MRRSWSPLRPVKSARHIGERRLKAAIRVPSEVSKNEGASSSPNFSTARPKARSSRQAHVIRATCNR